VSFNLALITGGPAILQYRGAVLFAKEGVRIDANPDTMAVAVDGVSPKADERVARMPVKITATPEGAWGNLSVLFPYFGMRTGSFVTPRIPIEDVNTGTGQITSTAHGLNTGDPVYIATCGTLPGVAGGALDASTLYYVSVIDADTVTLHVASTDATGNANAIAFVNTGAGNLHFVVNHPLAIQTYDGMYAVTFLNVALTRHAGLEFARNRRLYSSPFEFTAYLRQGANIRDTGSFYTIAAGSPMTRVFGDVNRIPAQSYALAWGSATPWSAFESQAGVKVEFPLTLTPVEEDTIGIVSHRLADVRAMASLRAIGMTAHDILAALQIQGGEAALGRSLAAGGNDLDISGPNVFCRLCGAALKNGSLLWNAKDQRSGELGFVATRSFVDNVAQPIAYVGVVAP
jgi:hypothetical protein